MSRSPHRKRPPIFEIVMLVLGVLYVSPVLIVVLNSFKTLPEIIKAPLALPAALKLDNFAYIFTGMKLSGPMLNSFLMCVVVIVSLILVAPMAAYSIVRRKMTTGPLLRVLFLAGLMIPFQIILIPLLQEFKFLGIQYTYTALWLHQLSWGLPLCIFIYSGFISTIPKELEEAAIIDGCGPFALFWRVVFPLLAPCTITIIIFWGLWIWNDFTQAYCLMGPDRGQLDLRTTLALHLR